MKFQLTCLFLLTLFLPTAFAHTTVHENLSTIESIDEENLTPSAPEASEESLPRTHREEKNNFTILSEARVKNLFAQLENNPRARNRVAGGKCIVRRSYIQKYLRKLSIISGSLYIQCPSNRGRMRLIDQVTGRRYTFSNFHDANIVAVPNGYNVMDVQFKNSPLSLSEYLAQVEASQKLKPLRNRTSADRGYCYWSIR